MSIPTKVVIIDDDKSSITVLANELKVYQDVVVVATASDSYDGEQVILKHKPQLIFLDIELPCISSDLVTKVQHGIDVPGTTIHVFYATKMGKKYEKRYCTYFKNPDIRRHNMQHEELFCCHSAEWVKEVKKAVEGDRQ